MCEVQPPTAVLLVVPSLDMAIEAAARLQGRGMEGVVVKVEPQQSCAAAAAVEASSEAVSKTADPPDTSHFSIDDVYAVDWSVFQSTADGSGNSADCACSDDGDAISALRPACWSKGLAMAPPGSAHLLSVAWEAGCYPPRRAWADVEDDVDDDAAARTVGPGSATSDSGKSDCPAPPTGSFSGRQRRRGRRCGQVGAIKDHGSRSGSCGCSSGCTGPPSLCPSSASSSLADVGGSDADSDGSSIPISKIPGVSEAVMENLRSQLSLNFEAAAAYQKFMARPGFVQAWTAALSKQPEPWRCQQHRWQSDRGPMHFRR